VKTTLNPSWLDKDVPELVISIGNKDRLARDPLLLKIWDQDLGNKDDGMGYALLDFSLDNRCSGHPVEFKLNVMLGGEFAGTITGVVEVIGLI